MAGIAFEWLVSAIQRMACRDLVVEAGIFPSGARVTATAIVAEMALVIVVFEVTTDAFGVELVRERVFGVAVATDEFCVLAVE